MPDIDVTTAPVEPGVSYEGQTAADPVVASRVVGDRYPRWELLADGSMVYGDGTAAPSFPEGAGGRNRGMWAAASAYKARDIVNAAGVWYARNADGVSRASFDATEKALWTAMPGAIQDGGTAFAPPAGAWDQSGTGGAVGGAQNATGFRLFMVIRAGVASNPGQNGHIYLDIAPPQAAPNQTIRPAAADASWQTVDYVAFRSNQSAATGTPVGKAGDNALGAGRGLQCILPKDWWYRLRTFTVPGYTGGNPQWILDGANPGWFATIT